MDHFSYEVMAKEKVKGFHAEGLRSQEFFRSGVAKPGLLGGVPKLILGLLGILGFLGLLLR